MKSKNMLLSTILVLLAVWVPALTVLELEWRLNEQYHYGYFVPIFALLLVYLRWEDRPAATPSKVPHFWLLVPVAILLPLALIQTANPDWRPVYWAYTLIALATTWFWVDKLGGRAWSFHLAPALAILLFAVPWFKGIENIVTRSLMEVVSAFTVEWLNLSGIFAVRTGNVIHLQQAVVGVEEACSGVRSLQSSLMAGYLFGELMRMVVWKRLALITLGILSNFLLNLLRTLTLTYITIHQGPEGFERWHDTVGNVVAVGGFACIAVIAWFLSRVGANEESSKPPNAASAAHRPHPVSLKLPIAVAAIYLLSFLVDFAWYRDIAKGGESGFEYGNMQWGDLGVEVESIAISPAATAQLKYSNGHQHVWTSSSGANWTAFYFNWEQGRISSHAGVHRPENCLPATGINLSDSWDPLLWTTPGGYVIPFQSMTFEGLGMQTHVFFAVWDENGTTPWVSTTWSQRLADVWYRRVVSGRHSLQFLVNQSHSQEHARSEMLEILNQLYPAQSH
jgi:exosortase